MSRSEILARPPGDGAAVEPGPPEAADRELMSPDRLPSDRLGEAALLDDVAHGFAPLKCVSNLLDWRPARLCRVRVKCYVVSSNGH